MELTRSVVAERAAEYREAEPLIDVEELHLDILPGMFAEREFGRRDAEWVVRWYFRRFLGGYPDAERRRREEQFLENDFDEVHRVLGDLTALPVDEALARLTDLQGVDVPVASAFLQFADPEAYLAVDERTWSALVEAGDLDAPYPDPPSPAEYERFLETCRALADEFGCDLTTLYRALWRSGTTDD